MIYKKISEALADKILAQPEEASKFIEEALIDAHRYGYRAGWNKVVEYANRGWNTKNWPVMFPTQPPPPAAQTSEADTPSTTL